MAINYYAEGVKIPPFRRREVTKWINDVANQYGYEVGDISYQFCDNERILLVNREFLKHDYYTDVITFNQARDKLIFADIIISLEMVESNAIEYEQSFERELLKVMIHGVLHICGLDDHSDEDAREMRAAEDKALSMLPEDLSEVWRKGAL